ncbi:hypothetical protein FHE73_04555 [Bacillus thuringiensis]|nr:hypothetical protein FHE73_04555 [Bacillus thuringiensis]
MKDIRSFQRNKRYQRFFKYIYRNLQYINGSTRNIDLSTNNNITNKRRLFHFGTVFPSYSAPSAVAILSSKFSLDNSASIKSAVSGSAKCI